MKADGANVVKMFASKSFRDGGGATLSKEQIEAGCQEAKAQGLRTLVHVYGPETIEQVSAAGCTAVEHGTLATPEVLRSIAQRGLTLIRISGSVRTELSGAPCELSRDW
jgi:imidazolonepropionase-like amidohydrolase